MEHSYKFLLEEEDYNNYIMELYNLIANTQEKIAKEMNLIINKSNTILKYLELRREIQKGNNELPNLNSQQIKELEKEFLKISEEARKEFIKSLKLFAEKPLSEGLKDLHHSILNTLQNYHIIIICLYIIENRFIQQIPIERLSEIKLNSSKLTVEQLYEALNEMYESKALLFINFIPCTNRVFDLLINSFKYKDKDNFIRIIYDNNLDLTSINKICNINLCIQHLIFLYEQRINLASTTFPIEMPSQLKIKICPFFSEIQNYEENVLNPILNILFKKYNDLKHAKSKEYTGYNLFLIIKEHLTNDELDNTQLEEICDKYLKQFDEKYLNNNFKINELFSLPKDYLERIPDLKKDSYIGPIKDYVKSQGNTSFEQLINLLSESECIENTITTKETLAYRLTGIKLSEKIIEHIKWKQDPMYLYYIIKHFYGKVDGKYIKISNFFLDKDSNPIKVNSPSSYVERLGEKNTDLINKIKKIYPDIEKYK